MDFDNIFVWFSNGQNLLTTAQLIAAFITALATFALWRVTRVLAVETSALAKMTSRPFVACGIESSLADATALNLVIRNTGNATAFDIIAKISPPLPKPNGQPSNDKTETSIDVSYLPPGQVLPRKGVMSRDIPDVRFKVEISWSLFPDSIDREKLTYSIDAGDGFRGGFAEKGIHQMVQELAKNQKTTPKNLTMCRAGFIPPFRRLIGGVNPALRALQINRPTPASKTLPSLCPQHHPPP